MKNRMIAFQGEHYAFSELAAQKFFGGNIATKPSKSFEEVFAAVKSNNLTLGIIPIENTSSGSIHRNYDLLLEDGVFIIGEINFKISLHLIACPGVAFSQIKSVYSHPAALDQCRQFINQNPQIKFISGYDTAGSVKLIAHKKTNDSAAIASQQAANDYQMAILKKEIEDFKENYTRFLIISSEHIKLGEPNKTSIVFATKHIPGALFKSLSVFFLRDINLLKIESRPLRGKPWQYIFYLDFEGSADEENCQNALNHLREISQFVKILGSYPGAT